MFIKVVIANGLAANFSKLPNVTGYSLKPNLLPDRHFALLNICKTCNSGTICSIDRISGLPKSSDSGLFSDIRIITVFPGTSQQTKVG